MFGGLIQKFGKNLKIWSAACSTGDEPYSLVMALSRHLPLANIKVIATDIDKQVIDTARMGLYNEKSIASVPDDLKKKYFTKVGNSYQISDEIKKRVELKEHDLLKDPYPGGCNLIVHPNVVDHFTARGRHFIAKFYKALGIIVMACFSFATSEQIMNYWESDLRGDVLSLREGVRLYQRTHFFYSSFMKLCSICDSFRRFWW